jgi:Flp pilus assembly protein TadD
VLGAQPDNADALHLLGLVAHQTDRHDHAVTLIAKAVRIAPTNASYFNNLGMPYGGLGKDSEATHCYRRAVEIDRGYAKARVSVVIVTLRSV